MNARRVLFIFLGGLTVLRWILGAATELSPDEAYYFQWSRRLDWAYFSKGPAVALAIRAGTAIFGDNEFGVRFFSPLLALGTTLIVFALAKKFFNESTAIWTALLLHATPIFNVGAIVMTIDPLSIFFWAAALATFARAIEDSPDFSLWWGLTGLFIGLGFLAKYTNAMELFSVAGLLFFIQKLRREFTRFGFWSMLIVFAICALPPVIWNAQHDWITLAHLKHRGGLDEAAHRNPLLEWLKFFGIHFGVYSPLIFFAMLAALWLSREKARYSFRTQFLTAFAVPLLALYFLLAFKKAGEPNWTAPAFVSLAILTAAVWHKTATNSRCAQVFCVLAIFLGVVMSVGILNTDIFRACGVAWDYRRDPGTRLRGWKATADLVAGLRKNFEAENNQRVFLIANTYGTASALGFYLPRENRDEKYPPVFVAESVIPENQYAYWPRYEQIIVPPRDPKRPLPTTAEEEAAQSGTNPFLGRTALFITDEDVSAHKKEGVPSTIRGGFERIELLGDFVVRRHGLPLRTIRVFACRNYLNKNLLE